MFQVNLGIYIYIYISNSGKDNKYWAGHFGVMMSSAQIRVRNESKTAEGDSYTDITKEVRYCLCLKDCLFVISEFVYKKELFSN